MLDLFFCKAVLN